MSNQPANELRYGRIKAVIWKNSGPNGNGPTFSSTLLRLYKDPETDEWRETQSLGRDDLLVAAKVLEDTFRWIASQSSDGKG